MTRTRALLTDNDQTVLEEEKFGQARYNARSGIRQRITEELPVDIEILREHEPGFASKIQDIVCRTYIESSNTPRVTQTAGTSPNHLLAHHPVPETGQTAHIQRTPTDTGYETIEEVIETLLETFLIEPKAGWFTIAQQVGSIQGNGADRFLQALHIPHSTISSNPSRYGSALYYARSNHPDASFVVLTGEPKADSTTLRNARIAVVGPDDAVSIPETITEMSEFEEQAVESETPEETAKSKPSVERSYFGGHTSTYHDLGDRLQLEPIEVVTAHRTPEMANHPYEVVCSNPFFKQPDQWLGFLPTEKESVPKETLEEYAAELAAHDRIRCFSTTDDVSTTLRAEEITVQHIPDYSDAFVTTNLYLPVTPR